MIGHDLDSVYIAGYRNKLSQLLSILNFGGLLQIECVGRETCQFDSMNVVNRIGSIFVEIPLKIIEGFTELSRWSSEADIRSRVLSIKRICSVIRPDLLADIEYIESSGGFDYDYANQLLRNLHGCPRSSYPMDWEAVNCIRVYFDYRRSIEHEGVQEMIALITLGSALGQTLTFVKRANYLENDCAEMTHCNCEALLSFNTVFGYLGSIRESLIELDQHEAYRRRDHYSGV